MSELTRRRLIQSGLVAAASASFGPVFWRDAFAAPPTVAAPGPYGPLLPPDANGLQLPAGFTSRVIARGDQVMAGRGYVFPRAPDGQACYATPDGGWILATNSELPGGTGGVSATRFDAAGNITDSYRILGGTSVNCAGGPTPWGTWLSCEEVDSGQVWECDPTGNTVAVARPLLGWFKHEACCVDPVHEHVYLSEDVDGGCFYRFVPIDYPDLTAGTLQVACPGVLPNTIEWQPVLDPNPVLPAPGIPLRSQIPTAIKYRRGEGMWFDSGIVYLVTTADHTVHAYDTTTGGISKLYEAASVPGTPLTDPDNIHVSARSRDVFVAEDSGGADPLDVCIIAPDGHIDRFLKVTGPDHGGSEVIGLTFNPAGTRFYLGSQRAATVGIVYEISGPFRPYTPPPVPPAPPAPPPPTPGFPLGLTIARRVSISTLIRRGLAIALTLDKASTVRFRLRARVTVKGKRKLVTLASVTRRPGAGATNLRLKPTKAGAKLLRGRRRQLTATLEVRITTPGAPVRTLRRSVSLRP